MYLMLLVCQVHSSVKLLWCRFQSRATRQGHGRSGRCGQGQAQPFGVYPSGDPERSRARGAQAKEAAQRPLGCGRRDVFQPASDGAGELQARILDRLDHTREPLEARPCRVYAEGHSGDCVPENSRRVRLADWLKRDLLCFHSFRHTVSGALDAVGPESFEPLAE
jgi:hypothetical protein